ncbi:MAG: 50S ribosomal protein L23 [Bacteroidia bacterium]
MNVLKRPIITEKTAGIQDRGLNKYNFEVAIEATKEQIKAEVERVYEVKVAEVNTLVVRGKTRSRYSKKGVIRGKQSNYKKAVVTLSEGEIDFYKHI